MYLDEKHNPPELVAKIQSVLPDAGYMIFDTVTTSEKAKQGKWLPDYETFTDYNGYESEPIHTGWICSLCGNGTSHQTPYCSQCGALMKVEGIIYDTL